MSRPVILIGAGENARVIAASLRPDRIVAGYLDDRKRGEEILGTLAEITKFLNDHDFFLSIGDNHARHTVFDQLKKLHVTFTTACHPRAQIEPGVTLGENVFVGAGAIINVGTTIGDNSFINTGCIVEHDNTIANHVHLAPGVITGGGTSVGEETFIGLGARIHDHISIGANTIVGAGAVVVDDLPAHVTAVGVPAKIIKHHT